MVRHSILPPKFSRRILMVAVLLGLVVSQSVARAFAPHHEHPKRAARQTVESMEEQWRLAQLNGDSAAMDRLLSDDFVGITAFGQVTTKAQQLAHLQDRTVTLAELTLSDIKVKMLGTTVAVVTSRAELKGTSNDAPFSGTFRYTRVYQRSVSGMWKITSFEATPTRGEGGGRMHSDVGPHP